MLGLLDENEHFLEGSTPPLLKEEISTLQTK